MTGAIPLHGIILFVFLFCCLVVLLFEFVNGFHDTANAVATVIYTKTLKPAYAIVWSGLCNFAGVLIVGTAVAMGLMKLVPLERLIALPMPVGAAVIIAVLLSSILWNLGTWYIGLPLSSTHTLVGAMIGSSLGFALCYHTGGPNWKQAIDIGLSLVISPVVGFGSAALLMLAERKIFKSPRLFHVPDGDEDKPPLPIRALLVTTCTLVSFFHGSNDGQKGVGLFMIILIIFHVDGWEAIRATQHAPTWVILCISVSLGLGTMIGWKRIVVTVGEKIGKKHLNYAQGATAEIVAAATIGLSTWLGLPVSTTHVLSSGVAGAMEASEGDGNLNTGTIKNIAIAWVLTLPAAMILSFLLFILFNWLFL